MYEPSRHFSTFHVAALQFYDCALVFDQLKVGAKLDLVPEPDNPHDPGAIEIRFEGTKLGYVPASENELMSVMASYGHADVFEVRVIKLDPGADPWRQVCVGVYVVDAR